MGRTKRELERRIADAIGVVEDEGTLEGLWASGILVNQEDPDVGTYMHLMLRDTDAWPFVKEFVTPPSLDLEGAESHEEGDSEGQRLVELVLRSFSWCDTEQGVDYWNEVYRKLEDRFGISIDPIDTEGGPTNVREAAYLLRSLFTWSNTKEGQEYWSSVNDNLLSVADNLEKPTEDQIRLVEGIARSFHWLETPQGFRYWSDAYGRLREKFNVDIGVGKIVDNSERVQETANLLLELFEWGETEEGEDYWADVHANLLDISLQLEREEGEGEHLRVGEEQSREEADQQRFVNLVGTSFWWNETPQGFEYWLDVYHKLKDKFDIPRGVGDVNDSSAKAREAAHLLETLFIWSTSNEGHDYWYCVYNNLLGVAKAIEKREAGGTRSDLNVQEEELVRLLAFLVKQGWCYTEQGEIYWEDVYCNLANILGRELTPEDLDRRVVTRIEAQGLLVAAFVWDATEQGGDYWSEVYRGMQEAWG